jgi:hypothetical protein
MPDLVSAVMAVVIGAILLIGVAVPIIASVVANASLTGTALTISNYLPTFLILAVLMLIVGLISTRGD